MTEKPNEWVILAARHLDATEGPVQIGTVVDASARAAIDTVLRYVAQAHNSTDDPTAEEPVSGTRSCGCISYHDDEETTP